MIEGGGGSEQQFCEECNIFLGFLKHSLKLTGLKEGFVARLLLSESLDPSERLLYPHRIH